MTQRNEHGREIWFDRFAWSFIPSHWKGVAYPAAVISVVVPLFMLADRYDPALSIVPLLSGVGFVLWLCERHSPPRR
jgi:hypothetical protein